VKSGLPIYSLHDEDPSMRQCIETFVYGLARQIDDLQEAELGGDFQQVEKLARDLVAGARRSGYPSLIDVAETTISACRSGEPDEVHKGIVELTELVQRVRRGSRGAA
jgi:hypothetical protein